MTLQTHAATSYTGSLSCSRLDKWPLTPTNRLDKWPLTNPHASRQDKWPLTDPTARLDKWPLTLN